MNSNWSCSPETPNLGQIRRFLSRVILKFDWWPCKTIGTFSMLLQALCSISYPFVNSNLSYSPETLNLDQKSSFVEPCDLQTWQMTLKKNNRAPLLCYFKRCASFRTHWELNWSYSLEMPNLGQNQRFFLAVWPSNLTDNLEKQQGASSMIH